MLVRRLIQAQRRYASTVAAHSEHHRYEGFVTPFWRNVTLSFAAVCAFYKYAPEPSDSVYLTRWLAMYIPQPDYWLDLNAKHTALSKLVSDDSILLRSAQQPPVRRYRYPAILEQRSAFSHGVGLTVDTSDAVVKS